MSYFQTLQGFSDNARESQTHAEEFAKNLRDEKVQSLRDKLEEQENNVEKWGGLVQGTADAWHMGRKILHHMKTMKAKGNTAKQEEPKKQPDEEESTKATQEEGNPLDELTNEEASKLFEPEVKPEEEGKNPFLDERPEQPPQPEPEPEVKPPIQEQTSYAEEAQSRIMGGQRLEPRPVTPPTKEETNMDEGLEAFKDKAGPLGAKAEEGGDLSDLMDGSSAIADGVKETAGKVASSIGKKVGVEVGDDVGVGVLNSALDGVPILGEIVGLSTLFGGMFHGIKEKKEEMEKEKSSAVQSITGQASVSGGIDVKSVLSEGMQSRVGGLV